MDLDIPDLLPGKKAYFASDFHLGVPSEKESLVRERLIVEWLEKISHDAQHIFLVGDLFDFWFEYRHVAPKGFVRFLGKLAQLSDAGVELIIFCGNHDLWFKDYLEKEIAARIIYSSISIELGSKKFYLAHGDGLGPGGLKFKIVKAVFTNPICQWLFHWIHPNIGYGLARFWSSLSKGRETNPSEDAKLITHSKTIEQSTHHDYYVYGDCHIPKVEELDEQSTYVNLGDWITNFTFGEFDGEELSLRTFQK